MGWLCDPPGSEAVCRSLTRASVRATSASSLKRRSSARLQRSWITTRYVWTYFLDVFGSSPLHEITPRHIDSWRAARRLAVQDSSVDREFNTIAGAFSKAVEWGYLERSPCEGLRRYGNHYRRFRVLSAEESCVLLDAAGEKGYFVYWIVLALHDTGMRPGELRGLFWRDVDFSARVFRLRRTKTGPGRSVYLTSGLLKATFALSRSDAKPCRTWPRRDLDEVCDSIPDFRLYDLRKTWITRALQSGVDVATVARAAGCSAETILKYYAGTDEARIRDCFLRAALDRSTVRQLKGVVDE